jgi:SP family galactose:H+ symporter-like MFS transporter
LSAIGTALAPTIGTLISGRIIVGIAIGIASFTSPMYMSEISPSKIKGSLVSINQLAVTIGIVVGYLVDYALSGIQGWRYMFGIAAIPSTILVIAMWRMPPSPRWLMRHNMLDKAREVLERIRGTRNVTGEVKEIQDSLAKQKGGVADLGRSSSQWRRRGPELVSGLQLLSVLQLHTPVPPGLPQGGSHWYSLIKKVSSIRYLA